MPITFHKMHGLGNDFVVLDLRHQVFPVNSITAIELADRNTGIGCDQVLVLRKPEDEHHIASFEIWNSDGSQAEQCGNGVRCLGLYLKNRSEVGNDVFFLRGPAGIVKIRCLEGDQVQVDMGPPVFDPMQIPLLLQEEHGWYMLEIEGKQHLVGAASMGNPHALEVVTDVKTVDVSHLGVKISHHEAFPEGCNAGFAEIINRDHIHLRVFERGAAETLACGSGACAAMSILRRADLVSETVNVTQSGGNLIISWTGGEKPVIMTGPATHVFEGTMHE
jgi:diaminopimelate epimerase